MFGLSHQRDGLLLNTMLNSFSLLTSHNVDLFIHFIDMMRIVAALGDSIPLHGEHHVVLVDESGIHRCSREIKLPQVYRQQTLLACP